ncbi:MAG TPA: hypothetical protein DIU15_02480 [Deltaproteobacteria bacterium]|nr:hypothetical protein [Deltaproteobacteria bacterium]HCP44884.1 hypothetical protein [Deltaproteobacteria bacterium]
MRTARLIGAKVGHFLAVLFLGSFVLACFLWVSPGSPGRATDPVNFGDGAMRPVVVGQSELCLDATRCGLLLELDEAAQSLTLSIGGAPISGKVGDALYPGPDFFEWFLGTFWRGIFKWDVGETKAYEPALGVVTSGARYTLAIILATLVVTVTLSLLGVALLLWLPFPSLRGVLRTLLLVLSITPVFILGYILQENGVLDRGQVTVGLLGACVAILCVGDSNLGEMLLHFETEVRSLRNRDYVHAASLRGASLFRHMLPGLLLPISSLSAAKIAFLLGSVVIAEELFAVPGLGRASLQAAEKGDALLLLTLTVFITFLVALVALIRDLLEIAIDPRLRKASEDAS